MSEYDYRKSFGEASTYLNKFLLFFDRFSNSPFHSFTTFMAWNSHRFENAECLMLKNSDSGLSRLFPNGKIIGDFQIKTNVISIKKMLIEIYKKKQIGEKNG